MCFFFLYYTSNNLLRIRFTDHVCLNFFSPYSSQLLIRRISDDLCLSVLAFKLKMFVEVDHSTLCFSYLHFRPNILLTFFGNWINV